MSEVIHPLTNGETFPFIPGMDQKLIRALNEWRLAQPDQPDPNAAILALLRRALTQEGYLADTRAPGEIDDPVVAKLAAVFEDALRNRNS